MTIKIIPRAEWGAAAPTSRVTVPWARRTEFVVHHSEGPTDQTVKSIQAFHMGPSRKWSDIGYNFLVRDDGKVYEGRGWAVAGAHATGHNSSGIGVCYIGRNAPTEKAKASIRALYAMACTKAGRMLAMRGHGQLSGNSTSCPGPALLAWVKAGMPTPTWTETIVKALPILKLHHSGEHVETLQGLLVARSHPEVKMTGVFDAETLDAVKAVQTWAGLDDDGIVGKDTWAALLRVA